MPETDGVALSFDEWLGLSVLAGTPLPGLRSDLVDALPEATRHALEGAGIRSLAVRDLLRIDQEASELLEPLRTVISLLDTSDSGITLTVLRDSSFHWHGWFQSDGQTLCMSAKESWETLKFRVIDGETLHSAVVQAVASEPPATELPSRVTVSVERNRPRYVLADLLALPEWLSESAKRSGGLSTGEAYAIEEGVLQTRTRQWLDAGDRGLWLLTPSNSKAVELVLTEASTIATALSSVADSANKKAVVERT